MRNTRKKFVSLLLIAFFGNLFSLQAQNYPDVPSEVPFGGINVHLDNSARSIIASDIKVLMINQKYWEEKLERALLYFPIIEGVLIDEEVPIDFKYLAAQESSLIPDAVSSSNAVGFWQFKEPTAKELGLRVDRFVDERKNISASTRAAATYLKRSNQTFNNWVSSLFSYYLGISGIKDKIPDNWSNAYDITLTGRSDRYVLRFFAYKLAFESGLDRYRSKNAVTLVEAPVGKGRSLEEIANELKISTSDLKNYNRWLNGNNIPTDKEYFLTIPVASSKVNNVRENLSIVQSDNTLANKYELNDIGFPVLKKAAKQPSGNNPHTRYEINGLPGILCRAGDYPNSLAKAGDLSPGKFRKYNDMDVTMSVVPGEVYYLARKNKKASVSFHSVRPGESLHSISQLYGIRLKNLMKYNRINDKRYKLETGRQMWLTRRRPSSIPVKIIDSYEQPRTAPEKDAPEAQTPAPIAEYNRPEKPAESPEVTSPAPQPATTATTGEIPRNPSERRRYTPKIADRTETPAPKKETSPVQPANSRQLEVPDEEAGKVSELAKPETTTKSNSRIVIVTEENASRPAGQPAGEDVKPAYSPTPSAGAKAPKTTPPAATAPERTVATTAPKPATRTEQPVSTAAATHTVAKGETFYSISKKYNMTISELLALNNLTISNNLAIGQKLKVNAGGGTASSQTAAPSAAPAAAQTTVHTVVKGETLFSISRKYNTTLQVLRELNNLKDTGVQIGQKLKVPAN